MLELEQAVSHILATLPQPEAETIPLAGAHGRFLSQDIASPIALPPFDNSSMDGYAVRARDVESATPQKPVRLRLIGRVAAGEQFAGEVAAGSCVRIFTGSPLPPGADSVVMQEDTRADAADPDGVLVVDVTKPWENVRFRGEDVKRGGKVAERGDLLDSGRLALLAATGVAQVAVARQPTVGLLATGSELREAGEPLAPGQIYESNRMGLKPLVLGAGGIPRVLAIVPDDRAATQTALQQTFDQCDVVVTCGGVSVGEMDFVKTAFEQLGGELQFWKVAIKPGRPFVFGRFGAKFLFGLPGNPVSAFVTFLLLVRPALLQWQGAKDVCLPSYPGVLAESIDNPGGRRHFVRVTVDGSGAVRSAGIQASHILSTIAAANGLVDVPPQTTFPAGMKVPVLRWASGARD